jgi:hypothetical protein
MEGAWRVLGEVGHWASLLPLAFCALQYLRHRDAEPNAWLLSAAFAVSFLADQVGDRLAAYHVNNWWVTFVYTPIQFGLFVAIVTRRFPVQITSVFLLGLVGILSFIRGPVTEPETMVHVIGGLLVGWLAFDSKPMAPYRTAILIYGLATVPFLGAMAVIPWESAWWLPMWGGSQLMRLLALAFMVRAIWTAPTLRLEVADGPRTRQAAAGHRPPVRVADGRHRHAMAASDY